MSATKTGIRSRRATQDDLTILWDFLAIAAYEPDVHAAKAVPFVAFHLAGWQRSEDFGFIAERDGTAIGARGHGNSHAMSSRRSSSTGVAPRSPLA
jgi:hypothetical protein